VSILEITPKQTSRRCLSSTPLFGKFSPPLKIPDLMPAFVEIHPPVYPSRILHDTKHERAKGGARQYVLTLQNTRETANMMQDHCIEMLRQVIMCKADTALMTYEWLPDFAGPWPNFGIQHECVDWERIDKWSQDRSIDVFDPIYLQHPKFGNSPYFIPLDLR
jgi:hypothetical protein